MFLFPQIKQFPDSSSTLSSLCGSFIFSNCSRRHLWSPFLLQNDIPQPKKKGMRRRGEGVWMIRNGNGRSEKQGWSDEEKGGCQSCRGGTARKGGPWKEEGGMGIRKGENPRLQGLAETSSEALLAGALISFLQGSQFETQRALMATSYLCKQAASWMWPWAPRWSWKESCAHFLSLVSSKGGTCHRISWLQKRRSFLFTSGKECH